MQRFLNLAHQTETKTREETERMCKITIQQLENLIGLKFNFNLPNGSRITYLNAITTILLVPDYLQYRELLITLLKQNNVNEKGLLLHLLGVINQYNPSLSFDNIRNRLITLFSTLPYHENINWDNEKIELETKDGRIKIYRYDKIIDNTEVYKIMRTKTLANYCHATVGCLKKYYPEDYIITSELSTLFGKYMYHSYFRTNEGTVDISNNMFYPNDDFNKIFCPKEILKIKTNEFEEQYKKFLKEENVQ